MSFTIRYADAPLGHEIQGVDVAAGLGDVDFARIEAAYDRYGVIVLRGQHMTPAQQVAFSSRFGPLDRFVLGRYNLSSQPEIFVVSNVIENGVPIGLADAGRYWHTDMWVVANPPRGSMLYALEVPKQDGEPRGDTCFASMAAAYDALPAQLRVSIEGRTAVYTRDVHIAFRAANTPVDPRTGRISEQDRQGLEERKKTIAPVITHPLVKVHPRTGRKCIYFSEGAISHIEGLAAQESDRVLADLQAHVLRPEFIYRHRWEVGDIVMWDNISCIHKATGDFELPLRRLMHRTTLAAIGAPA